MPKGIQSHFVKVNGSNMHYLETGDASKPVMLFLHGMPTSSYLWRHVMSAMKDDAHCIALDLIGMGRSDSPDIDYRVFDHIDFVSSFINELGLKNITLVMHGWGSVIGFAIAKDQPDNIRAMAFYESHLRAAMDEDMLSLPVQQLASLLAHDHASYTAIVEHDYLVEKLLPRGAITQLPDEAMRVYREPFQTVESRKPLWQYVHDLPIGQGATDVTELIDAYSNWLKTSTIPKLLMYAWPGFITTMDTVAWARDAMSNVELVEVGEAMHFAQETIPEQFSATMRDWFESLA